MSTQLWTVRETAARLRCGKDKVYDLIAKGELPVIDVGTGRAKTRVAETDLAAYIDAHRRTA